MAQTQEFTVRLSDETVQFVRSKVASGEFASECDVICESLESFRQPAEELARWEREVVGPAHDRLMADPSSALSFEEVQESLEAKRVQRLKAS